MELKPSVRAEFLVPGTATLVSAAWLVGTVSHLVGGDPSRAIADHVPAVANGTLQAVVLVLAAGSAAYAIGIAVVMATYDRVAKGLRGTRRELRREALLDVERRLGPPAAGIAEADVAAWLINCYFKGNDSRASELSRLVDSIALDRMSPYALQEHDYRRSVRQVAAGMVPAVAAVGAVGVLTDWVDWGIRGIWTWGIRAAAVALAVVIILVLRRTVVFQEDRRQQLLLHTAWLRKWHITTVPTMASHPVDPDSASS